MGKFSTFREVVALVRDLLIILFFISLIALVAVLIILARAATETVGSAKESLERCNMSLPFIGEGGGFPAMMLGGGFGNSPKVELSGELQSKFDEIGKAFESGDMEGTQKRIGEAKKMLENDLSKKELYDVVSQLEGAIGRGDQQAAMMYGLKIKSLLDGSETQGQEVKR